MSPCRSCSAVSDVCKVMLGSPWSDEVGRSACARRARKRAAKTASGSMGVGAVRSASNGSGMARMQLLLFRVGVAKRLPRAHEERFGGVLGAVEDVGDVGDGQVVQIAKGQHRAMLRRQSLQGCPGAQAVQVDVPWVFCLVACLRGEAAQAALLTSPA